MSLFLSSGRKTGAHFSWNCFIAFAQFRTENRCPLFLELLQRLASTASQKMAATFVPSKRSISRMPVGEVTLISVI